MKAGLKPTKLFLDPTGAKIGAKALARQAPMGVGMARRAPREDRAIFVMRLEFG